MTSPALTELLASYVPQLIRKRVIADPSPIESPVAENFQAAVLFADISGFTMLTEHLAEQGPTGVESLARILNEYFGQLIDIVHEYGGDIVKFAGDAVLALWPCAAEEDPRQWTLRAAECALKIRERLVNYKIEDSILYLKLAISTGDIGQVHVGGVFNRWEFLLTGAPLVELGIANRLAGAGEILLAPSAWKLIRNDCRAVSTEFEMQNAIAQAGRLETLTQASSVPASKISLEIPGDAQQSLRAYIPGAIINRLTAGQVSWIAELRRVTVLFINLPDINQGTELATSQEIARLIQNSVYRYEGSINKINVDDKGITIVAALGLPPFSHEDDPARGVQAALMIRKELTNLNVRSMIGITTGRIFCGSIGNQSRREYTIMGNPVNLSARLMSAAGNLADLIAKAGVPILCDRVTYDSARDAIEFETVAPQYVKGRSEAVEVFHPVEQKRSVIRSQTDLIGRQEEKAIIANALQEWQRGEPLQVVILHGEAGIGKSRLTEDFLRQAQSLGARIFQGGGDTIEKSNPYFAWRPVFQKLFNIEEISSRAVLSESDHEMVAGKVAEKLNAIDPDLMRYAPLLDVVLPVVFPENEFTSAMTGEIRGGNIRELLVRLLEHEASLAPLLIVVEDLHWLDSASWAVLGDAFQKVRPLMLFLNTRPFNVSVPPEFKQMAEAKEAKFIKLDAMMLDDVEALVCQRLGVKSIPPQIGKLVREKSEGHPFFAEELAFALRDTGVLTIENNECRLSDSYLNIEAITLPDTLQAAITNRIDSLNPSQQLTLKVASVIGRIFAFRMLQAIHPIEADKPALNDYMENLTRVSLTLIESDPPDLAYIFKHAVTQEVAYNLMLFSQRRQLHQAVAEWIERSYERDIAPYYPLLAYHWSQAASNPEPAMRAQVVNKAVEYLEKAGDQSLNNFANVEAIQFFLELLRYQERVKPSRLQLGQWYRKLGDAYLGLGQLDDAKKYFLTAMDTLGLPLSKSEVGMIGMLLGHVIRQASHRLLPQRFRNKPLNGEEESIRHELITLCQQLSVVQFLNGDPNPLPMMIAVTAGVNIAETMRDSAELGNMYAQLAAVSGFIPLRSEVTHYKNAWRALADKFEHPAYFVQSVIGIAAVDSGLGLWEELKPDLEKAISICEELGNNRQTGESLAYLTSNALIQGDAKATLAYNQRLDESARRRQNPVQIVWVKQLESYILARQGELQRAVSLADEAIAIMESGLTAEISDYVVRSVRANALWELGRTEESWSAVKKLLDKLAKASVVDYSIYQAHSQLTEILVRALERARTHGIAKLEQAEVEKYARLQIANLKKYSAIFPIGEPALYLLNGALAWYRNDSEKAFKFWKTAAEKAHAFPMVYEEGLAHLLLGQNLKIEDPERSAHIQKAAQVFESGGFSNRAETARGL